MFLALSAVCSRLADGNPFPVGQDFPPRKIKKRYIQTRYNRKMAEDLTEFFEIKNFRKRRIL
jgi:hypothetical protein